jgi:hypothetical protein
MDSSSAELEISFAAFMMYDYSSGSFLISYEKSIYLVRSTIVENVI